MSDDFLPFFEIIFGIKVITSDAFPPSEASAIICQHNSHPVPSLRRFLLFANELSVKIESHSADRCCCQNFETSSPHSPCVIHTFYSSQEIDFYPKKLRGIHVFFLLPLKGEKERMPDQHCL